MRDFFYSKWFSAFCLVAFVPMNSPYAGAENNMDNHLRTTSVYSKGSLIEQLDIKKGGKPNTTYVISEEIDLGGKTISLPDACVLKFEGGCLSNGCIVGNNTVVDAQPRQIFSLSLSILGSWNIKTAFVEWFGCKAQKEYNKNVATTNADAIQKTINAFKNVSFGSSNNGTLYYYVSAKKGSKCVISVKEPVHVSGKNQVSTQIVYVGEDDIPIFYFSKDNSEYVFGPRYTSIRDLCIRGVDAKNRKAMGIYVEYGVANVTVENILFNYLNECFTCDSWAVSVNNCKAEVANIGFKVGVKHKGLASVTFNRCSVNVCKVAYDISDLFYSYMFCCTCNSSDLVWRINDCIGLTLISSGAEHCKQFASITSSDGTTRNIKFINGFVSITKDDTMTQIEWSSYFLIGDKVSLVELEGLDFEMNEPKVFSKQKNRDKRFIKIKSKKQIPLIVGNNYCSLGDINSYIARDYK